MIRRSLSRFDLNLAFACLLIFRRVGYGWNTGLEIGLDCNGLSPVWIGLGLG